MTNSTLNILGFALYLSVGVLLAVRLARGDTATGGARVALFALAAGAWVLHGAVLYTGLRLHPGFALTLTEAFSLVAWVVAALYLVASLSRPIDNLGIVILPTAGITLLAAWLWPGHVPATPKQPQAAHIVISIFAFSLLCLAAVQSLMLALQESQLRHKHPGGFIRALPPMQTMETTLFQLIGLGFFLLTATLVTGVFFSETVFGTPFKLTHHIVLSALAWVVYATLLIGRWWLGWRGRTAVRFTVGGFTLLVLGYFGTKFVVEVVLGRPA